MGKIHEKNQGNNIFKTTIKSIKKMSNNHKISHVVNDY